jgi:hypothetical protein
VEQSATPKKAEPPILPIIFLVMSILFSVGYLIFTPCAALQFMFSLVFLVVAYATKEGFDYAKANFVLTFVYCVVYVLIFVLMYGSAIAAVLGAPAVGAQNRAVMLASAFALPTIAIAGLAVMLILYGVYVLALVYLTYKAAKGDRCPWL